MSIDTALDCVLLAVLWLGDPGNAPLRGRTPGYVPDGTKRRYGATTCQVPPGLAIGR